MWKDALKYTTVVLNTKRVTRFLSLVTADGEDYGKIYECKAWPASDHCGTGTDVYSPLNTDKQCNGEVCWPIAWTYIKGCTGTITPTATPTFDPANVEGCPDEYKYNGGTEYEEGDKVSVTGHC
eukprot:scaffold12968_cov152-Skeletonema_marinoi.AAC.1